MITDFPRIWIPKRREIIVPRPAPRRVRPSYRPRPSSRMMAQGVGQLYNNTTARLDQNGRIQVDSATNTTCNCGCPCACTSGCNTGTTVGAFTLVASGISFGTGSCMNHVGQAYKLVSAPSDMNGTFTLAQLVANCCTWKFAGSNSGSFDTYSDAFCTHLVTSGIAFTEIGWFLTKITNGWRLQRDFADSTGNNVNAFYAQNTTTDPIDCNPSTISFSSTNTTIGANDPLGDLIIATGGSATVTFP